MESENEVMQLSGDIQELIQKNAELLKENNVLLKKIHRHNVWSFWSRILWYTIIIGLPFALYFYVLEPYFEAFGSSYENFLDGMNELPGLKGIDKLLNME